MTVREALKSLLKKLPPSLVMRLPSSFVNRTYFSGLRAISLPPARRFFMFSDPTSDALAAKGFDDHGGEALRCFLALLPRTRTFVDVGANTGVYGLLAMSKRVPVVHAFEPVPFILERLNENAALNGFPLRGTHAALGYASGEITIYVPKGAMPTEASTRADFRPGSAGLRVPLTTLDEYCRGQRINRIDLLKIDTESTEPDVLRGAVDVIRRHRPVILCEVLFGLTEAALHAVMDAERYAYYWIREGGLEKVDRIVGDRSYRFLNFLFVPIESESEVVRVVEEAFTGRRRIPETPVAQSGELPAPVAGERHVVEVGGHAVSYFVDGPSSTVYPPLLLVHSVNAAASAYEVKPLYDHYRATRTVYALDLPGYGTSDRSDRFYTPRVMTDAVLAVVDAIRARHGDAAIDVVGVSLSSEFVARASLERPGAFRAVCVVSATGLNRRRPFYGPPGTTRGKQWLLNALGRAPWSAALFRLLTRPGVIRFFLQKTWGSKAIDEGLLVYDVVTTRQPGAANAPFHFLSAFLFSADITRVYEQVPVPVLLVHGTRGDFVNYVGAEYLIQAARWTVHTMQTGALPYFEDLAGFVAVYDRFVDRR